VGEDRRIRQSPDSLLRQIEVNPEFELIPVTVAFAREVAALGRVLPDPADRVIVATAMLHGLRLVTSAVRIIESKLVRVVE
jgi:PIN domain nuclease of toxin-antitoxin system